MTLRRASVILPANRLDDFPTHLASDAAAELLAAWTAVWHPAILHATQQLPGWHSASEPPEPSVLEGELIVVSSAGRQQLPPDWLDRLRATSPRNPAPVEARNSRDETVAGLLRAAGIDPNTLPDDVAGDFFAVGF